jgi:hypothetical protein
MSDDRLHQTPSERSVRIGANDIVEVADARSGGKIREVGDIGDVEEDRRHAAQDVCGDTTLTDDDIQALARIFDLLARWSIDEHSPDATDNAQ